jgi:Rab proteins geranylgeranyltransferase component A
MTDTNATSAENDNEYDLVIEGTGLTESILAAAASWSGRKVLHVDKNTFYGSHWAALSLDQLDAWVLDNNANTSIPPRAY